jgi:limonene-1,2-epoxide hydrolase
MTPEELLRRYIDRWNAQQGAEMANLYAERAERISPLGLASGRDAIRASAEGFWEAFPDSRVTILHYAAKGDVLFYEFTDEGTHTGPLMTLAGPVAGSGKTFRIVGVGIFEMADGVITAERLYFDAAALMIQLGLKGA